MVTLKKSKASFRKKAPEGVAVSKDTTGNYSYTNKVSTPTGPRYYQGTSKDQSIAQKMANFKERSVADSTKANTLSPAVKAKLNQKSGGKTKKCC